MTDHQIEEQEFATICLNCGGETKTFIGHVSGKYFRTCPKCFWVEEEKGSPFRYILAHKGDSVLAKLNKFQRYRRKNRMLLRCEICGKPTNSYYCDYHRQIRTRMARERRNRRAKRNEEEGKPKLALRFL